MIVLRKLDESANRIQTLTLTACAPEDFDLLAALYDDYSRGGPVEITLRDGRRLTSTMFEKRRSPRITTRVAVVLLWKEGSQEHRERTFTVDLSQFGCAVYSHRPFLPGTSIRLEFEGKVMDARTVYSLQDHSTNLVEVGMDFGRDCGSFWGITILKN